MGVRSRRTRIVLGHRAHCTPPVGWLFVSTGVPRFGSGVRRRAWAGVRVSAPSRPPSVLQTIRWP